MCWLAANTWFFGVSNKKRKSEPPRCQAPAQQPWTSEQRTDEERLARQVLEALPGLEPRNPLSLCRGLRGTHTQHPACSLLAPLERSSLRPAQSSASILEGRATGPGRPALPIIVGPTERKLGSASHLPVRKPPVHFRHVSFRWDPGSNWEGTPRPTGQPGQLGCLAIRK